jgi:hypothetical protein
MKKNLGACFLILHIGERRVCKELKDEDYDEQVHEHLMNKSLAQAKQCRRSMEIESTLGHELALDSLPSHRIGRKSSLSSL